MLTFLKDHPFAVESFFDTSLVLTFAVPKEELKSLIPECLSLDTFQDKWAFLAVAIVKTKRLRPKGFPGFMGNDFILTGYRLFVQYVTQENKRLRGLYIIRSETDKPKMAFLGNIFTHYNYKSTDVDFRKNQNIIKVNSIKSRLSIEASIATDEIPLPDGSPFSNWKEARRFAGPLPFTFTYNQITREVLIIEGVRQNWIPKPVQVLEQSIGFVHDLNLESIVLANAFIVSDIPYYWKKGRKELWRSS